MAWKELPRALRLYIFLLVVAGLAACANQAMFAPQPRMTMALGVYALLAFLTSRFNIKIPYTDVHFSMDTAFVYAALMLFGPLEAMAIDGVSKLIGCWPHITRKTWYKAPFNVASGLLSVYAAGLAYYGLLAEHPTYGRYIIPLLAMSTAYFLVNTGSVALAISISTGANIARLWYGNFLWTGIGYLAATSIAVLLFLLEMAIGWLSFLVSLPILALVAFTQRVQLRREEESRRHIEQLESMHMSTIETLSLAIDAKDQITHGHVHRVTAFVTKLAEFLGVSGPEELKGLRFAALVHDIGKIGIPDLILAKPGRFTADEMERMRMHPVIGAQIVKAVSFDFPIAEVVLRHHERWDGRGYPHKLRGDAINRYARMLAICDVYDALRSDRPYRRALCREKAVQIIRDERGGAFDPEITDVFLTRLDELEAAVADEDRQLAEMAFSTPSSTDLHGLSPAQNPLAFYGQITYTQQEVILLYEVAQMVGRSLPAERLAAEFVTGAAKLIPYNTAIVFAVNSKDRELRPLYVESRDATAFAGWKLAFGQGASGWVAQNGQPLRNVDPEVELGGLPAADPKCQSVLSAPLRFDGRIVGVVSLYSEKRDFYLDRHQDLLLKLAGLVTPGLVNALKSEELLEQDDRDELTGLPGVRSLKRRLAEEPTARAAMQPYTLYLLDLRNLHDVNVRYGHEVGDRLLRALADGVASALRPEDGLFRSGGGELAVIAEGADKQGAAVLATRLRRAAASLGVKVGGGVLSPSMTMGWASFPDDGINADELWRMADGLLQKNKVRGAAGPARAPEAPQAAPAKAES